jgi:protein-S-isoprenylcysteine O-methyltransferase Ste14
MMIFSRYSQSTRAALLCFVLRSSFMKRPGAILGSAIFLVIAPGTIAGYLPWTICQWHFSPPLLGFFPFRVAGVLMIAAGLPVLLDSFARFAIEGLGTPAPVVPPKRLLVSGLYRYVRNPMYVALSLMIFGQGLLFGSVSLLEYGVVVWLGFFAFVVLYEEPTLRGKFGKEYEEYCARVPRWIPRLKPVEVLRQ